MAAAASASPAEVNGLRALPFARALVPRRPSRLWLRYRRDRALSPPPSACLCAGGCRVVDNGKTGGPTRHPALVQGPLVCFRGFSSVRPLN